MKIVIGADFVPTKNEEYFSKADCKYLLGDELTSLLKKTDFRIFNLEVPLVNEKKPIEKFGPNLIARTESVALFSKLNINLFTLANNHIMDQGQQGLNSTCTVLDKAGIAYTGVGKTPEEAAKPYIFECDGKRIGVYACTENEFSIVTEHSAGANPIDILESPDHVAALKTQCDFVIVLYHGGKEHYRYPSPTLQKVCRKLVEKGADLVVCQHSHCIGCEEKYLNGTIVYGQGNFLFDNCEIDEWQTSLLIEINDGDITYIPLKKHKDKVRIADPVESATILKEFKNRSEQIKDSLFIEDKYKEFATNMIYEYLWVLCGANNSKVLRIINKLSGYRFYRKYLDRKFATPSTLSILNFIECEAHREVIVEGLKNRNR